MQLFFSKEPHFRGVCGAFWTSDQQFNGGLIERLYISNLSWAYTYLIIINVIILALEFVYLFSRPLREQAIGFSSYTTADNWMWTWAEQRRIPGYIQPWRMTFSRELHMTLTT